MIFIVAIEKNDRHINQRGMIVVEYRVLHKTMINKHIFIFSQSLYSWIFKIVLSNIIFMTNGT